MKRNREGWLVSETERQCTNCFEIFQRTSKTVALCAVCNSGRVKTQSAPIKMWRRAKARAVRKDLDFNIEIEDIEIPKMCPILKIPLFVSTGKSGAYKNSPSLDRIDSSKGYIKGNIQVISQLANSMKGAANWEELKLFADWVYSQTPIHTEED